MGHLNLATAFVIMGTYCVVSGWVLWYLFKAISTGFVDTTPSAAANDFGAVMQSIDGMLLWTALSLILTSTIIYFGVNKGIERSVRVLMPALFLLMISLVIYNAFQDGFLDAAAYLFTPDFSKVTGATYLAAIGQAFFSIGVGMAGMMIFGSYLPQEVSITRLCINHHCDRHRRGINGRVDDFPDGISLWSGPRRWTRPDFPNSASRIRTDARRAYGCNPLFYTTICCCSHVDGGFAGTPRCLARRHS